MFCSIYSTNMGTLLMFCFFILRDEERCFAIICRDGCAIWVLRFIVGDVGGVSWWLPRDELRFYWVRRYGEGFIMTRPRLAKLASNAKLLLDRYGLIYMFIYRYPKGMRTIGAIPVALTEIKWIKFTLLFNAASAALWTAILTGAGFLLVER